MRACVLGFPVGGCCKRNLSDTSVERKSTSPLLGTLLQITLNYCVNTMLCKVPLYCIWCPSICIHLI